MAINVREIHKDLDRSVLALLASDLNFGPRSFQKLIALGKSPGELWSLSDDELVGLGLEASLVLKVKALRRSIDPQDYLSALLARGIAVLTQEDAAYPEPLKRIAVPPAVLFVRGTLPDKPAIAIVGTRRMTAYGRRTATRIAEALAGWGFTIVSGLALGIDGVAHRGAVSVKGLTVGVLASGVDRLYPVAHSALAEEIIATGGAVISEFPPGTQALKHHFPIRNRIIAGLSQAVIVVEAAVKSGSLLTARSALEENREVFAVPGLIDSPYSEGPHYLIQMGAKLLHEPKDVLTELGYHDAELPQRPAIIPDSDEERIVLEHLGTEPSMFDDLVVRTALEPSRILSTLTLMEMKGKIRNLGNNVFARR